MKQPSSHIYDCRSDHRNSKEKTKKAKRTRKQPAWKEIEKGSTIKKGN